MARLTWDKDTGRLFEAGIDRGVLYEWDEDTSSNVGVSWNGITEVVENANSASSPMYFDGQKVFDLVAPGDFSASLKAYTYPDEFLKFEGVVEDGVSGLFLTNQSVDTFGLSYRTLIGNPDKGTDFAYKIHILYNLTAIPSSVSRQTIGSNVDPLEFSWDLSAVPVEVSGFRPTAHIIIDSRALPKPVLIELETVLYGYYDTDLPKATQPPVADILDLLT